MTTQRNNTGSTLTLATLVAATGGFLFGYDTAVINGGMAWGQGCLARGCWRGLKDPTRLKTSIN